MKFFTLLAVAFIVLKLTSVIDWSWWWVLAPLWGPWTFWVVVSIIVGILADYTTALDRYARSFA
jgi:hypothetical protein